MVDHTRLGYELSSLIIYVYVLLFNVHTKRKPMLIYFVYYYDAGVVAGALHTHTWLLSFSPIDCRSFHFHVAASGFFFRFCFCIFRFRRAISDSTTHYLPANWITFVFCVHSIAHCQPALVLSIHLNFNFHSRIIACGWCDSDDV